MYEDYTNEELKQLAIDIEAGLVMTNYGIPEKELGSVFQILQILNEDQAKSFADNNIMMIYEYMANAVTQEPLVFTSFKGLNPEDTATVSRYCDAIKELKC